MVGKRLQAWQAKRRERARQKRTSIHDVRGFRVAVENVYPDVETAFVLARLDRALALIEQHAPARYAHLRRDLCQIWVVRFPTRGRYYAAQRTCMTELSFLARVAEFNDAEIASCILHEGVHARVDLMGRRLGFRRQWSAAAEERLCRRAEVAFGRALPPELARPVLARAEWILAQADDEAAAPTIDWRQAHYDKFADDLKRYGTWPWAERAILAFVRWRVGLKRT